MINSGDEYGHTKFGNNNTYCQDNALNWFGWKELNQEPNHSLFVFISRLIHFRRDHPVLHSEHFVTPTDVDWFGVDGGLPDWSDESRFLGVMFKDLARNEVIYIAFNTSHLGVKARIPKYENYFWHKVANTSEKPPYDFDILCAPVDGSTIPMLPYSSLIVRGIGFE